MMDYQERPEADFGGVVECVGYHNIIREEVSHRAGGKSYCIRCFNALGQEQCTNCRRIFITANGVTVIDGDEMHRFCGETCRILYYGAGI